MAKRLGIRVFHMEAGNRCYDDQVPEETNRRLIDHSSDILLPYTERSRSNLLVEGIPGKNIYVTGNPIAEVLDNFNDEIGKSTALERHEVDPRRYFLLTLHRSENVDNPFRLSKFIDALNMIVDKYEMPVIWSVHPHTRERLSNQPIGAHIKLVEPLGLFDFTLLEKNAYCVLTDSGTVQEECCLFQVPVVTLRDTTERPETIEAGSNFIAGCEPDSILNGVETVTRSRQWVAPPEYLVSNVSDKIARIVMGHYP